MRSSPGGANRGRRSRLRVHAGVREPPLDGGGGRGAPDRPQLPAAPAPRPLRRAVERHRVHRPAGGEPAFLALPDPAVRQARPGLRGGGRGSGADRPLPRERTPRHAPSLASDPDPDRRADGLPLRASHHRGRRRSGDARRHGEPRLRRRRLDGPAILPERGRRAPRGAAAGPGAVPHRARDPRRGARRDRDHPARGHGPRRARGRPRARLCLRELRRGADPARARADRRERPRERARLPLPRRGVRGGDGDRTFAEWSAEFDCPPEREDELVALIAGDVFQGGFDALARGLGS